MVTWNCAQKLKKSINVLLRIKFTFFLVCKRANGNEILHKIKQVAKKLCNVRVWKSGVPNYSSKMDLLGKLEGMAMEPLMMKTQRSEGIKGLSIQTKIVKDMFIPKLIKTKTMTTIFLCPLIAMTMKIL